MSEDKIIDGLRRAAERRETADRDRHAAAIELRKRVQEAHAAGLSPTRIAQEARLSRQAVYEALSQRPS
jgi:DNA-binding phage protein